jgi:sporulation integral membrane protein YlbJ
MKKWFWILWILLILGFLLLAPDVSLQASRFGLSLWFDTLVPTLLPFLVFSGFLIHSGLVRSLSSLFSPLFGRLYSISPEGSYALFTGFLCGYPVGAKVLGDLSRNRRIHPAEAQYLLGFCNNVSPSFVITFLVTEQLKMPSLAGTVLLILYGLPLLYGLFTKKAYLRRKKELPFEQIKKTSRIQINFELLDACIYDAVHTLLKLGGYVILFSILAELLNTLSFLPEPLLAAGTAVLEITNGIPRVLSVMDMKNALKILLPATAFGGVCALSQTFSVLKGSDLSLVSYLRAKLLLALMTFLASLFL